MMRWSDGNPRYVQYESLARMLFGRAFFAVRMPAFPRRAPFARVGAGSALPVLQELARELRLPLVPHTGGWSPCWDGGDVALVALEPPGQGLYLEAAAADDDRLGPLQHILERLLPVRRTR